MAATFKEPNAMIKRFYLVIFCLFFFVYADSRFCESVESLRLISGNDSGLVGEYQLPSYSIVNATDQKEVGYSEIEIPDTFPLLECGKPKIVQKSFMIAIPEDVSPRIEILYKETEDIGDINIPLAKKKYYPDESFIEANKASGLCEGIFNENTLYPQNIIEIDNIGFLRNQKVARVTIYPARYLLSEQKLKICKKLKFKIHFDNIAGSARRIVKGGFPGMSRGRNNTFDRLISASVINSYSPSQGFKNNNLSKSFKQAKLQEFNLKVKTKSAGFYVIGYDEFKKLHYAPESIDPRNLRIFHKDVEVPLFIEGEDDGKFDKGDFLVFYANDVDSEYSRYNIYILSYGSTSGLRMAKRDGTPTTTVNVTEDFRNKIHFEENIEYVKYTFEEGADHWYWSKLNPGGKKNFPFEVNNPLYADSNITVTVSIRGFTYNSSDTENHHAKISLNGELIGEKYFKGQEEVLYETSVSDTSLIDGENYLSVENPGDTGSSVYIDIFLFNSIDVNFRQKLKAEKDEIIFSLEGNTGETFGISDFSGSDIWAFDISNAESPEIITGVLKNAYEDEEKLSKYKAYYSDNSDSAGTIYLLSSDKFKKPLKISEISPQKIKGTSTGVDYIAIVHDKFFDAVKPLLKFREKKGLKAKAFKISDIYNEFSSGIPDAQAIKDFLRYAYENWDPVPTYVLLVGDTVLDYKNYLNYGRKSYIPVKYLDSRFSAEYPSDSWFVEVNGDDIFPDMLIGRIPANSVSDLKAVIKKIKKYENGSSGKVWQKKAVFVADNNDDIFQNGLDYLADTYLYSDFSLKRIYLSDYNDCTNSGCSSVTKDILDSISAGTLMTVYSGHGNVNNWAGELALQTSDLDKIKQNKKYTFLTTLNCNNGYFVRLGEKFSLGEKFLMTDNGGAIGAFVSTGLAFANEEKNLSVELFKLIFDEGENELGYITTKARVSAYSYGISDEIIKFFLLFGDPALRLKINTERIIPQSPLNGDKISKQDKDRLFFSWQSPQSYKFRIQFSEDEPFTNKYGFKIPLKGWIKKNKKKCEKVKAQSIRELIDGNDGEIFWRIKGKPVKGVEGKTLFSTSRKMR